MEGSEQKAIWYYVGNYGQLGPLTRDQIEELIEDAVIVGDTYVWRPGMADWKPAAETTDFSNRFRAAEPATPPPIPEKRPQAQAPAPGYQPYGTRPPAQQWQSLAEYGQATSDRSRVVGGLLNMLPGFGRFYLGYSTHGVLQLLLTCIGFGWIWSIADGLWILSGGVKYDGYGRKLQE